MTTTSSIEIRPTSIEDCENICKMRWGDSTRLMLKDCRKFSIDQCKSWIGTLSNTSERYSIFFENSFIGLFRVDNIDYVNKNCCVGLDIDEGWRGRGLSKQIYKIVITDLFHHRNFECLWLEVLESNNIAINLYKKLGFKVDGILRNRVFRNNKYNHILSMSLLRGDYE